MQRMNNLRALCFVLWITHIQRPPASYGMLRSVNLAFSRNIVPDTKPYSNIATTFTGDRPLIYPKPRKLSSLWETDPLLENTLFMLAFLANGRHAHDGISLQWSVYNIHACKIKPVSYLRIMCFSVCKSICHEEEWSSQKKPDFSYQSHINSSFLLHATFVLP